MYIAQVRNGTLDVVETLGPIDPNEHLQAVAYTDAADGGEAARVGGFPFEAPGVAACAPH